MARILNSARGALGKLALQLGAALMVNSTGTTWKYLSTTSVQPT